MPHLRKFSLLATVALAGCMVGPNYHRPITPLPLEYKELPGWVQAQPADLSPKGDWWTIYHDPLLTSLEARVGIDNQNVRSYVAQYDEALAIVQEARAQLFPTVTASGSVERAHTSSTGSVSGTTGITGTPVTTTTAGTTTGTGTTSQTRGRTLTQATVTASASWDLDVWGRIRRQVQSDVAAAEVSAADLQNAKLSAQGALATDYVELRYQDSLQDLEEATVRAYEAALRITQNQVAAGTTSPADEAAAITQLESARANLVNVGQARGQYEHAIAVLIGVPPTDLSIAHAPIASDVPAPSPGLPSTLLQRRPDIAAAERMMDAENALVGVQIAAFYPDLSLSLEGGWEGPISGLFSVANRIWSLGANATEIIFEGGARTAAVRAARDAYDSSVADYRQTVLTALQQVEDDLIALRILAQQADAEAVAIHAAQHSVTIALNEYEAGTQPYTAVVTEQTALFSDQQSQLSIQEQRLEASVALVQALGGGWTGLGRR